MSSQCNTWRFGSGVASSWGGPSGQVQSAWNRGWQCQWCKAWCKAKAKCCHQCCLRWAVHPVNARVGSPGRGAGESAARTSSGETSCGCHGAGQMHGQDLGGHEEVPQHPTRSCERNGDVNEDPRGGCGPPGDVFFSASWGREGAGGEQEQAVEAGTKAADTGTTGSGGGELQHTTASTASTVLIAESLDVECVTG